MRKGAAQYIEPMSDALPRRLLPSLCALCHGWSRSGRLCAACCARFVMPATRCRSCAIRVPQAVLRCHDCQRQPPPFARALVAVDYAYPWDGLLQRFNVSTPAQSLTQLSEFLNERWKGVQPVAWGDALRESEFTRWVYLGLCGLQKEQQDEI